MKILLSLFLLFLLALPSLAQRGRADNAPKVGDPIPEVSVIPLTGKKKVDLSKPEKTTVLLFGSHT